MLVFVTVSKYSSGLTNHN